ncbi:hypothetical protein N0V90_008872 [Kalmusia sp. IMI 367209]|nr:hypothetical protein N0V90_008872 [Kalmusia sp. IMI 367209]
MSSPPEVVRPPPGLEVYHEPAIFHSTEQEPQQQQWAYKADIYGEEDRGVSQKPEYICGVRRSTFWLAVVLAIVVIAAAVGGGVAGSLAVSNAKSKNEDKSTASTPAPTTATVTVTNPSSSTPSPTSGVALYAPTAPQDVLRINVSCPSSTISSFRDDKYSCKGTTDFHNNDITGIQAYTLQACIDACSTYNLYNPTKKCKAVVIGEDLATEYAKNSAANCWLKNTFDEGGTKDAQVATTAWIVAEGS